MSATIAEIVALFHRYASHDRGTFGCHNPADGCDCGFTAALREIEDAAEAEAEARRTAEAQDTAAQRPPDPAAPDLRGLLNSALLFVEHWPACQPSRPEGCTCGLNEWSDATTAALDEKQVGAGTHPPEED